MAEFKFTPTTDEFVEVLLELTDKKKPKVWAILTKLIQDRDFAFVLTKVLSEYISDLGDLDLVESQTGLSIVIEELNALVEGHEKQEQMIADSGMPAWLAR